MSETSRGRLKNSALRQMKPVNSSALSSAEVKSPGDSLVTNWVPEALSSSEGASLHVSLVADRVPRTLSSAEGTSGSLGRCPALRSHQGPGGTVQC